MPRSLMVRFHRSARAGFALVVLSALIVVATPVAGQAEEETARRTFGIAGAGLDLPFSGGVMAGDFLFLSGAIGNVPGESTVTGSPAEQTKQALANLEAVLEEAGMGLENLVATTVYVSDLRLYTPIGRTLASTFAKSEVPPTRGVVEADIAVPGSVIEIAAVAARPGVEVEALAPEGWPRTTTGYSWGVRAGDTVFVAAQVGAQIAGRDPLGDLGEQTTRTLDNIKSVLAAAELELGHLVACRVYLPDARDFAGMNTAWREVFKDIVPPTRATIRGRMANPDFRVGIQCIAERGDKKVVSLPGEDPSRLPFSPALQVGDTLYLSGFVGRGPDGYPAGLDAQTVRVIDRLAAHLEQAGMGFEDVVSAEVWLDDARHYSAMNEVYAKRLPKPAPARATVASRLMSPDARVEIAMIAIRRDDP